MKILNEMSTKAYITCRSKVRSSVEQLRNFAKDERGASDVLAMIIIIGLVLAIALVFRKQIINLVEKLWSTFVEGKELDANHEFKIDGWNSSGD